MQEKLAERLEQVMRSGERNVAVLAKNTGATRRVIRALIPIVERKLCRF